MTRILAIDPSSTVVGLFDGERAATIAMPVEARPERLGLLLAELRGWFQTNDNYDFVVYEEQFVRGGAATKALYGAVGVIEACAVDFKAGVMSLPQSSVKKWAQEVVDRTGKLKRDEVKELYGQVAAMRVPRNIPLSTQDEMDAACMYYYVREKGIING